MKTHFSLLFFFLFVTTVLGQDNPAYVLYNTKGKKIRYSKMLKQLQKSDIILFGEYHNDPIAHWLQLEVTQDLHQTQKLCLGAEMLETDIQEHVNAYLENQIDVAALDSLARLWSNHKTDYAPLLDFAKANQLAFIATNIPRRYASRLFRQGLASLDSLTQQEKSWIVPLPFPFDVTIPSYQSMFEMADGNENFPHAQAIKDATMAHFILKNYERGETFLHYNGAFHSDNYEGILWYLKKEAPRLEYATISLVLQDNIKKLASENMNRADFIICVPSNMTRTY